MDVKPDLAFVISSSSFFFLIWVLVFFYFLFSFYSSKSRKAEPFGEECEPRSWRQGELLTEEATSSGLLTLRQDDECAPIHTVI